MGVDAAGSRGRVGRDLPVTARYIVLRVTLPLGGLVPHRGESTLELPRMDMIGLLVSQPPVGTQPLRMEFPRSRLCMTSFIMSHANHHPAQPHFLTTIPRQA